MSNVGDRVGAISHSENDDVYFYGYGTYQGDSVPPKNVGGFNIGHPNPEIKLDNGNTVYGCECWWGAEEEIKKELLKYKNIIRIEPKRA